MKVYALRRAGGGLLATRVALVHKGVVVRPVLAVDTGSIYTLIEPAFLAALGCALSQPVAVIDVVGVGGRRRLPCFVLERLHCFGRSLGNVRKKVPASGQHVGGAAPTPHASGALLWRGPKTQAE